MDLNELIHEAVILVQRELANYRVVLRLELAPDLPAVRGDRVELQRKQCQRRAHLHPRQP